MPDEPTPEGGAGTSHRSDAEPTPPRPQDTPDGPHGAPYGWYGPSGAQHQGQPPPPPPPSSPPPPAYPGGGYAPPPPYQQHGPYAPYQGQAPPYGHDPYGHDPYGHDPYGQYGHDPYGQYGHGPYGAGPYGQYGQYGAPYGWSYLPPPPPVSPEERRRRKRRALVFGAVLVLAVGAGIGIGASIAPANPTTVAKALITKSIAAAANAGSYRYAELSTVLGTPDDISGDAGPTGGRQVITQGCKSGTNVFDLRLVNDVVYFRGNSAAVVDQLGVPSRELSATVDHWVKVVKGEKPYSSFAEGITTTSNISQLGTTIVPSSSKSVSDSSPPTTKIVGSLFSGKGKPGIGSASLVITSSTSVPRSLRAVASSTAGRYTLSWTFSHFGEPVQVSAPASSVPYSGLHATPPAKGTCA